MSCRKLEIRDLTVALEDGSRTLVDRLTLTVPGGGSLAVVGESGAGKSMTTLAVMGLLPKGIRQTEGSVLVNHQDLKSLSPHAMRDVRRKTVGVIMQNPMSAFDPVFTVYSHFKETVGPDGTGSVRARAAAAVAEVGLDDPQAVLDAYPFQLSGGMLQRVMIALALVNDPDYLIADEPTTDLDVIAQKKILDIVRDRLRDRHTGLLLITHDLSVARYMADRIAIMHRGQCVEEGPADAILQSPAHPYSRVLTDAHNHLYGDRFSRLVAMGERQ